MTTLSLAPVREHFGLTAATAGIVASSSFVGMFVGAALAGMLGDKFGRKRLFSNGVLSFGLSAVLSAPLSLT